jgi:hypothetical protein
MRLIRLLLASLFSAVSISIAQAQLNPDNENQLYYLKTEYRGDGEALTSDPGVTDGKNSTLFMTPVRRSRPQFWKVRPDRDRDGKLLGTYSLSNYPAGESYLLGGNPWKKDLDFAYLSPNSNGYSGQSWKIEAVGNGYFRLKTTHNGTERCLEGNQKNGELHNGATFLSPCKNESGQFWKFERTTYP